MLPFAPVHRQLHEVAVGAVERLVSVEERLDGVGPLRDLREAFERIAGSGRVEVRWSTDDPAESNTRALRALLDVGARVVSVNAETRSLEDAYLAIIKESRQP